MVFKVKLRICHRTVSTDLSVIPNRYKQWFSTRVRSIHKRKYEDRHNKVIYYSIRRERQVVISSTSVVNDGPF